jgi:hypothetical protein
MERQHEGLVRQACCCKQRPRFGGAFCAPGDSEIFRAVVQLEFLEEMNFQTTSIRWLKLLASNLRTCLIFDSMVPTTRTGDTMEITVVWAMWADKPDLAATMRLNGKRPVAWTKIIFDPQWLPGSGEDDMEILEALFRDTNLYTGSLWDRLEPVLPEDRTHTALSVGDFVMLDSRIYRCASLGWSRVSEWPAHVQEANR